jgi:hypothetical protein
MEDADLVDDNLLSDKMKINLHMLGALMLNGVGGEVHGADVVAVDKGAPRQQGLELVEQLSQPSALSHAVGNNTILGLNARVGDNSLSLGRPGNQVVPASPKDSVGCASCLSDGAPEGHACADRFVAWRRRCRAM